MKTHVILIHGFNVSDAGAGSVGKLAPYFQIQDCSTEVFDYGHFGLFAPRWRNKGVAQRLDERIRDVTSIGYRCVVVGHSNGAAVTHLCQAPIDRAVYVNPALDRYVRFPDNLCSYDVWHNPHDRLVSLARLIPFHPWGDMGRTGFTRYDSRGRNHNMINFVRTRRHSDNAHSKPFSDEAIKTLGPAIVAQALNERIIK